MSATETESGPFVALRRAHRAAKAELHELREERDQLREAAAVGLAVQVGVTDPRQASALAKLMVEAQAPMTPAAARETMRKFGLFESFGIRDVEADGG